MKIAFQMDSINGVNINADSTFRLAEEAQARGHELFYYGPDQLAFDEGRITATGHWMTVQRVAEAPAILGERVTLDLADMDVIWLRQDPPFDMHYITTTHLLERLKGKALVVNDPFWVRNFPEKLLVLGFEGFTPPTMIARDLEAIKRFRVKHGDIILKPLYGNGGAGVFRLTQDDRNLSSLHELFTGFSREPLIVQKYLPDVTKGDKRVILVDGKPVGAINRVPAEGEVRSNMHVGGRPEKVELTERDLEICAAIGPTLRDNGQIFVGIDVIGDWLTEINVTSPTGIQELERFDGINVAEMIWQAIEAKVS
ncbi:glutathione synthase [Sagittula marina]|uniref:Glutathione synthetase n=1 Tax=Sagittula marina TaxID=943940 RepID=A0A7W6GSH8_9RHOB|nr:glutathione synthase [Sagittula marina]MBB3986461.1 glutathione synthase [Sagittula marina]